MANPTNKKIICFTLFLGCLVLNLNCRAKISEPTIPVKTDPRVELMSLIFRLAGNPEYRQGRIVSYVQEVDKHFAAFKDHEAVKFAAKLRVSRGISYDAVMGMAIHVTDAISLEERVPFDPQPETLDNRWTPELAREFCQATRRFVADSKFPEFIQAHSDLFDLATSRMQAVMEKHGVVDWLKEFYGARPGAKFTVILGMLNGPASYGPRIRLSDKSEILYCILGVWGTDKQGNPQFDSQVIPTVVHEFCHSYCNPLVDKHASDLEASGKEIFKRVKKTMTQMAYGNWQAMIRESLVRASVVRFLQARLGEAAAKQRIQSETKWQFFWIGRLSNLLEEYEQNRSIYSSLDDFFPKIVEFFSMYVGRIDQDVEALEKERQDRFEALKAQSPKIVAMVPTNGSQNMDPNLKAIVITFDRPMKDKQWAVMRLSYNLPDMDGTVFYDQTRTVFTIPVKLKPDTEYELGMNAEGCLSFASEAGDPLYPVVIQFKSQKIDVLISEI